MASFPRQHTVTKTTTTRTNLTHMQRRVNGGYGGTGGRSGFGGVSSMSSVGGVGGMGSVGGIGGMGSVGGVSGVSGMGNIGGMGSVGGVSGRSGVGSTSGMSGVGGISGVNSTSGMGSVSGRSGVGGTSGMSGVGGISGRSGVGGTSGMSGVGGISGVSSTSGMGGTSSVVGIGGVGGMSGGMSGVNSVGGIEQTTVRVQHQEMDDPMEPDMKDTSHMTFVDGRCSCCPYGYHIDLDFLRYLEALNNGSYLRNLKKIHRNKKKLRKSLEVLVQQQESGMIRDTTSAPPPDVVHSTDRSFSSVEDGGGATSHILDDIDFSVDTTFNSIDLLMRNGGEERGRMNEGTRGVNDQVCRSEAEIQLSGGMRRSGSFSSLESSNYNDVPGCPMSPSALVDQLTQPRNTTTYVTSTQLADNMAALLPEHGSGGRNDSFDLSLGQTSLQAIREQMALSLQRMRELEEQVKAIPVLQVRISVLKEEKRLLMLQLRAKNNKLNMRSIGVGDSTTDDSDASSLMRFQTSTSLRGGGSTKPSMRSVGVGDATVDSGDMVVAVNSRDTTSVRVHQRELHTEQKSNEYEREVRTMFIGGPQAQPVDDQMFAAGRRSLGRPSRPLPPTRSIGVGDNNVFDTGSSMHVHEKELRTLIIGGTTETKNTRNVGIVCKAPTRDVGVMYMYEDAKPNTCNVAVGVGEMGVSDTWELAEGGIGGTSVHTTLTAIQQMNLASFHSKHIHIKGEQLRLMLDEVLRKDLHSVSIQTDPTSTVDKAVNHTGYNMVDIGCGGDTINVDVRPVVHTRSVAVESRTLMQNRSVATDKVLGVDTASNTPPTPLLVHRSTCTNPVKSYPASTNTDQSQQHTTQTNTDVKIFEALEQIKNVAVNTSNQDSVDAAVNTEVEVKVVEAKVVTCDRANNTQAVKQYSQAVNTVKTLCIERASNTEKARIRNNSSNTDVRTMYSTGVNVNTIGDSLGGVIEESVTRGTTQTCFTEKVPVVDAYDLSTANGVRVQRSSGSTITTINERSFLDGKQGQSRSYGDDSTVKSSGTRSQQGGSSVVQSVNMRSQFGGRTGQSITKSQVGGSTVQSVGKSQGGSTVQYVERSPLGGSMGRSGESSQVSSTVQSIDRSQVGGNTGGQYIQRSQVGGTTGQSMEISQLGGSTGQSMQVSQLGSSTGQSVERSQLEGSTWQSVERSQLGGSTGQSMQVSQLGSSAGQSVERSQLGGSTGQSAERSQIGGSTGQSAGRSQIGGKMGQSIERSQIGGPSVHSVNERSQYGNEGQGTRTTRQTVTTYTTSSSPVVSRKIDVMTSGDRDDAISTSYSGSSVHSTNSRHSDTSESSSRYSDAKDSDFDVDTVQSSSSGSGTVKTYMSDRFGDTSEWSDAVGDTDGHQTRQVVTTRSSPHGTSVTTKTTRRVTTSSYQDSTPKEATVEETFMLPGGIEFQRTDGGATQMRVVRHTETAYVGGNAVKHSTNVTIQSDDNDNLVSSEKMTSSRVPDLLQGGTDEAEGVSTGRSDSLQKNNVNGNSNMEVMASSSGTILQASDSGDSGGNGGSGGMTSAVRPKSIMKQTSHTIRTVKTTETSKEGSKKEISFSEDVQGGDVTSSEEELEEDESVSGGSQSSVSYDEASYDSRLGKIEYSCTDDEVIAGGAPGAAMYDQNIRETFELEEELAGSCRVYAQWLQDSTQITTKELNSSMNIIQQEWFKVSSHKLSNCEQVEDYLTGFSEFSKELLQQIINMSDANGNTALHYAVSHGNMDIVGLLLDSHLCDINKENKAGYTAIMLASLAHIQNEPQRMIVKKLFETGDVNARALQAGQTALMLAVSHGRLDMVRMLMEAGADVNMRDEDGSTALMCASEHGHTEIVKILLAHPDIDPTLTDNDGSTPLSIAMEAGHRDIGVLLYAHVNFKAGSPTD